MGEYLKYKNREIKIGTCESLYYASYQKFIDALNAGYLKGLDGMTDPSVYVKPDAGFLFRFPFPDEDKFPIGDIDGHHHRRGLPVMINFNEIAVQHGNTPIPEADSVQFEIVQQKLVHREEDGKLILALVVREPSSGEKFRVEEDKDIKNLIEQLHRNYIINEPDEKRRKFYAEISSRILKGYNDEIPQMTRQQSNKAAIEKPKRKGRSVR